MLRTVRFWLHTIWGQGWDRERRRLLFRHYWAYLSVPSLPVSDMSPGSGERSVSADAQRAFSAAYRAQIAHVQSTAATSSGVFLTFRPIGKNLRLMGTAIRANVDRGRATDISSGGPPSEERSLLAAGQLWSPWIWSRDRGNCAAPVDPRDTAAGWATYFSNPGPRGSGSSQKALSQIPTLKRGDGPFHARHLTRVLKVAAATSYVFSPVPAIEEEVASLKRRLGWPPTGTPVLGMHIRRGDAAASDRGTNRIEKSVRASFPLVDYLDAADRVCDAHGIRYVFVATESADDVHRARELRPMYTVLAVDHDRRMFADINVSKRFMEYFALEDPPRARALAQSAILDLALFRDCSAFVGAFNSEFSVLTWLLAIGAAGRLIPFISLSAPRRRSLHPFEALLSSNNNCPLELYHW